MFENLIESKKRRNLRSTVGNSALSVMIHGVLIALAVYATLHAGEVTREEVRQVDVTVQTQAQEQRPEEPPPPEQIATVNPPPRGFQTLSIPTNIPVDIPPPSQNVRFDAADFSGVGVEGGIARGVEGGTGPVVTDQPYLEAVVEERPETIANTCITPRYPEILRQAGIEGRVLLEFVIDTLGRAERGSIRVVNSTHNLFEAPARETVTTCRFRAGRIQGRAVRVRVQIPITFSLQR
ncbi:MAG TPA: energy transducer TonB [Gemmatimonadales bacterium]|nr:energy transducer TonB [Gemmatimonadales bacterium]